MNKFLQSICIGGCLLITSLVNAQDTRYYDIELIVFESTDREARITEAPSRKSPDAPPEKYIVLGEPYPGPIPGNFIPRFTFRPLHQSNYKLEGVLKLLKSSKNYNVLMHKAWRQPGMDVKTALPVRLHQEYTYRVQNTQSDSTDASSTGSMRSVLDGYVRIILSRYLHAEVDLSYTLGVSTQQNIFNVTDGINPEQNKQPDSIRYHLKQSRKMRSNEIHYIDHPVLGVIVLATPYEGKVMKKKK